MDELFDEGAGLKAGPVEKISAAAALVGAVVSIGLFVLRVAGVLNLSHSILESLGWLLFELFFFLVVQILDFCIADLDCRVADSCIRYASY